MQMIARFHLPKQSVSSHTHCVTTTALGPLWACSELSNQSRIIVKDCTPSHPSVLPPSHVNSIESAYHESKCWSLWFAFFWAMQFCQAAGAGTAWASNYSHAGSTRGPWPLATLRGTAFVNTRQASCHDMLAQQPCHPSVYRIYQSICLDSALWHWGEKWCETIWLDHWLGLHSQQFIWRMAPAIIQKSGWTNWASLLLQNRPVFTIN